MKRLLLGVLGITVIAVLGAGLAVLLTMYSIFGHNTELVPGMQVGPATLIVDRFVAVYAIPTDSGVLLIDAGTDPEAGTVIAGLAEMGFAPEDVAAIFLTHGHSDHIAGAAAFDAPVYAMAEEVDIIEGRATPDSTISHIGGLNDGAVHVSHALSDGDVLDIEGVRVTAHLVPGHTPGSAVYEVGNVVFVADAASAHTDGTLSGAVSLFSEDTEQSLASLRAMTARTSPEVDTVAFGHSGPAPVDQLGRLVRATD